MKTLNNKALENRDKAIKSSKKIIENYKIFSAPTDVKKKRAMLGTACGTMGVLAGGACIIVKSSTIGTGLLIGGVTTLGINLATSKLLNKK